MKVRNGFVSNSSSSSFIIAIKNYKDMPACPTCGHIKNNDAFIMQIKKALDSHWESELNEITDSWERALEIYNEGYFFRVCPSFMNKELDATEKEITQLDNHTFIYGEESYHDDLTRSLFENKEITQVAWGD